MIALFCILVGSEPMAKRKLRSSGLFQLYYAAGLLLIVLASGVIGFRFIEGYPFLDSLYMVVITIATVGFKEVAPLSDGGKWFTIFLILTSFGIFGYVISTITRFIVDGGFKNYYLQRKVERIIKKSDNHVIVCGYGRNGSQACRELKKHGVPFIVIENRDSVINRIREDQVKLFIEGDATNDEVLDRAGVMHAKALVTTLPNDADNTFVVLTARSMNPDLLIISRASGNYSDIKLKRAGANNIIMPDRLGGIHMAKLVVQPDVVEFIDNMLIQGVSKVSITEIPGDHIQACYLNGTIGELQVRSSSGATIIGMKTASGEYVYNPSPEARLTCDDKLFVIGTPEQIDRLKSAVATDE